MINMRKQLLILGLSLFVGVQTLTVAGTVNNNSAIVATKANEYKVFEDAINFMVKFREDVIFVAMGESVDVDEVTANLLSINDEEFSQIIQVTTNMMRFTKKLKEQQLKMTSSQRIRFNKELEFFETWMDTVISIYPMRGQ